MAGDGTCLSSAPRQDHPGELHALRPVHGHHQRLAGGGSVPVHGADGDAALTESTHEAVALVLAANQDSDAFRLYVSTSSHDLIVAATVSSSTVWFSHGISSGVGPLRADR